MPLRTVQNDRHLRAIGYALFLALTICAGCAQKDSGGAVPRLTQDKTEDNSSAIVGLVDRLCVANSNDNARFAEALAASGWPFEQVQGADGQTQLAVWRLPEAELAHSQHPLTPKGGKVWVCSLRVSGSFAPAVAALQSAFAGRYGQPRSDVPDSTTWEWRPTFSQQATMTLSGSSSADGGGVMIFVELMEMTSR